MTEKQKQIKYWFVNYGIRGKRREESKIIWSMYDFFPLKSLTDHLTKEEGKKVIIRNFIEVSEKAYLESLEK
jgi:hypothetical protein